MFLGAAINSAADEINRLRAEVEVMQPIVQAAKAVVERWETPLWKDAPATATYIYALRDALDAVVVPRR